MAYFAASCDEPEENKKFAESLDLDYPILSDPGRDVARAYGVIEGDGKYAARHTIYIGVDGKVAHIDTKVNVMQHGQDVAAKMAELGFPEAN